MWPWFWFLAPNIDASWHGDINYPFSGAVTQDLSQSWFEKYIRNPAAGDPAMEQRIFEIASYGKQLGILTELLLDLAQSGETLKTPQGQKAFADLQALQTRVEQIKKLYAGSAAAKSIAQPQKDTSA